MPTELNKTVRRVTRGAYRVLYARPQKIVASFEPGDLIRFRVHKGRQTWDLPIDEAFYRAVQNEVARKRAEKRARRKAGYAS